MTIMGSGVTRPAAINLSQEVCRLQKKKRKKRKAKTNEKNAVAASNKQSFPANATSAKWRRKNIIIMKGVSERIPPPPVEKDYPVAVGKNKRKIKPRLIRRGLWTTAEWVGVRMDFLTGQFCRFIYRNSLLLAYFPDSCQNEALSEYFMSRKWPQN